MIILHLLIYKFIHSSFKVYSIFGSTTIYDPTQRFINHFGNPFAIVQIQFHPFMWTYFDHLYFV